ncbi:dehydrogenase [Steroidobacter agaridevorans]|uniref:Dehydrogenase n=1 Tax=Steroidobacter agaridevorans TaxID=2695856 RepID=A0A829YAK2_9GAMM|nr:SDR family oxidoreductase [Steroidobacter agaridevorans]GFE79971.1 dehydrogenase [Steroidobacter agaridevorans]GFE90059.1 dehydrogenase [Steroidobacter agaridevorans]
MKTLSGHVALVTGAASGIGAAIVARLQAEGARVAGLDVKPGAVSDLNLIADMRSTPALEAAVAQATKSLGAPDILVHAAAASFPGGVFDTDPQTFLDLYDVNVVGAVRLLQLCTPGMSPLGGAVVFLSSINADYATPTLAAYAATKAALNNLVKTAALELAPSKIRVNAIAPASIDTPLLRESFARTADPEEARIKNVARHPLGRLGSAEEVAELVLFLASDRAQWITGSVYPIDGGAGVTRR